MSDTEPIEVDLRITAALDYAIKHGRKHPATLPMAAREDRRPVTLDDLTTVELGIASCSMIPAHTRLLTGRPGPVILFSADYGSGILDQESTGRAYLRNE